MPDDLLSYDPIAEIQIADDLLLPDRLNADLRMLQEWRAEAVAREMDGLVVQIDEYIIAAEMLIGPTRH